LYQRDFEEWDRKTAADKNWINLKLFIQEAYQRRLNATSNMLGQHGYVQNAFAVLEESDDDEDANVATVITQMAALTTQSQLTAASTAATSSLVTAAIHQLNSNQQAMMQQMATYANANTVCNLPAEHNPPLTHSTFLQLEPFSQVGTHREAEGPDVGEADAPLSSVQVDAELHAPQSLTIRRAKVIWVRASCQLLSREHREPAWPHETRPLCTPTLSNDTPT